MKPLNPRDSMTLDEIPEATIVSHPDSARNSSLSDADLRNPAAASSPHSRASASTPFSEPRLAGNERQSDGDLLERKPTLEPGFMRTLQDQPPDDEVEPPMGGGGGGPSLQEQRIDPSILAASPPLRKTGFESWLRSNTSARSLFAPAKPNPTPVFSFRELTVRVRARRSLAPASSSNAVANCCREFCDQGVDSEEGFTVLNDVSGVFLGGQMTLVIGMPGCGKTALLRALAGRLRGGEEVHGSFKFLGEAVRVDDPLQRRRTAFVSAEDHGHIPNLTVRETLRFAAELSATGSDEDIHEAVERILESLGLSECADTVVGGEELRGVSGGQKRRVTLGEMLFSRDARLLLLDQITDGLDSAKAAQIMRIVRSACRVLGFAACVALLQPTDHVFDMFDRVLVLDKQGGLAFFGPTPEAVPYFETVLASCGVEQSERPVGMSACEFVLMTCTHHDKTVSPKKRTLPELFSSSRDGTTFQDWLQKAQQAPPDPASSRPLAPFCKPWSRQFVVLARRRLVILKRNPATVRRVLVAAAFGIVLGSLYGQLANDLISAFARCGFFFLTIFLSFMLSAAITVPDNFRLRLVFFKHHGARFYSSSAMYLAHVLVDSAGALVEAFLLTIIPYWWVGLRSGLPGGYGYFFAVIVGIEFVGQALSRLVSAVSPTEVLAILLTSAYIMLCGAVSGFMPQYKDIPVWWQWLNWITPVAYAYEGLVLNNLSLGNVTVYAITTSNGTGVLPLPGPDVAWLFGVPRFNMTSGDAPAGLTDALSVMGFDVGLVFCFALLLDLLGWACLVLSHRLYEPSTRQQKRLVKRSRPTGGGFELFSNSLLSQFSSLMREQKQQSRPSDLELALADPLLSTQPLPLPATAAAPPRPLVLHVVDLSYSVPLKSKGCAEGWPAALPQPGQAMGWSIDGWYALLLARAQGGWNVPAKQMDDELPAEERPGVQVLFPRPPPRRLTSAPQLHRPRDDVEGGGSRARAWSNKLRMSQYDDGQPVFPDRVTLLNKVTAAFHSSTMTALLGESGSGKTTLMDVIAGYKTGGSVEGDILINGLAASKEQWTRLAGYAEQADLHCPYLSVYESLVFAGRCRLPASCRDADVRESVERVLESMSLGEFRDCVVGRDGKSEGLPKHARKRFTVAVELVAKPRILFLDEPTTGLDTVQGEIVMEAIRCATRDFGLVTLATVHQPSRSIFAKFDSLLLLQKGGRTVYHGQISSFSIQNRLAHQQHVSSAAPPAWLSVRVIKRQQSSSLTQHPAEEVDEKPTPCVGDLVLAYFGQLGAPPVKQGANPADHIFTCLQALEASGVDAAELYEESKEKHDLWLAVQDTLKLPAPPLLPPEAPSQAAQLAALIRRHLRATWRDPALIVARFGWTSIAAVMLGTLFFGLEDNCGLSGMIFRIAALFFSVYVAVIPMQVAVAPLVLERAVVYREQSSGTYNAWANGFARLVAEVPVHFAFAVLYYAIFYYTVGLQTGSEQTGYFIIMIFFAFWLLTSFGQMLALAMPNIETAQGLAGLVIILSTILMGFLIPVTLMPAGWAWAPWANMLYYMLQGLCVNELAGLSVQVAVLPGYYNATTLPPSCTVPAPWQLNASNVGLSQRPRALLRTTSAPAQKALESPTSRPSSATPTWRPTASPVARPSASPTRATLAPTRPTRQPTTGAPTKSPTPVCYPGLVGAFVQATTSLAICLDANDCIVSNGTGIDLVVLAACLLNPFPSGCGLQAIVFTSTATDVVACLDTLPPPPPAVIELLKAIGECIEEGHEDESLVLCVLLRLFPDLEKLLKLIEWIERLLPAILALMEILKQTPVQLLNFVLNILFTGQIRIPASVILLYFNWARIVEEPAGCEGSNCTYSIVADTQWYYCLFAVGMFLLGMELAKLFAGRFIVWVKR